MMSGLDKVKHCQPGLSSSKSESILNAVQGLTPKVAADSTGMSLGKVTRSSAFNTAAVLHVPVQISAGVSETENY